MEIEVNSGGELYKALRVGFTPNQIIFVNRQCAIVAGQDDLRLICSRKSDRVMQTDRLENGVEFVIAVGALAEYVEVPVDFGEGGKCDGLGHDPDYAAA